MYCLWPALEVIVCLKMGGVVLRSDSNLRKKGPNFFVHVIYYFIYINSINFVKNNKQNVFITDNKMQNQITKYNYTKIEIFQKVF